MATMREPPKTMHRKAPPAALLRAFEDVVQPLRGAERRKMFGYPAVFVKGHMFAGLLRDVMILRLGTEDRERFLELPGAKPFVAMKGRVMKQWAVVPPAMTRAPAELCGWVSTALTYARSLPPKPVRRTGD